MEVFRCDDMQRLLSEESYSVYAPCMYRPDGEKYRERMEKYASDPAVRVYLCEDGGKTAGILILDRSGNAAEILGIAVAEDRRRQGIGSRMIRQVMRLERLDRIIARTDAEAVGFYRKCGFSEKKEIVEYPSGTAERYYCELKTPTPSLTLYKPEYGDLWFRQKMLSDEETMAYNRAWGGTIPFPETAWKDWYERWIVRPEGKRFYRFVKDSSGRFAGEIAYHYDGDTGGFMADVIIYSKYRGKGYGGRALDMLCAAAAENGVEVLYDDIAIDNPAIGMFLRHGFSETGRTEEKIILKKELYRE